MDEAGDKARSGVLETFMEFPALLALVDQEGRMEVVNSRFAARFGATWPDPASLLAAAEGADAGWRVARLPSREGAGSEVRVRTIRMPKRMLLIIDELRGGERGDALGEMRERIAELEQLAASDHLTGAWNRAHLDRVVDSEIGRSLSSRQKLSLVLFDIDHFKKINDTFGHAFGDAVLCELVRLVRSRIRSSDILFRWGGEEFVVLVSSAGYRGAEAVAENLRSAVADHAFGGAGRVTISLGVAEHAGAEGAAAWFLRLDEALYAAKRAGRNCVVVDRRGNSDAWAAESGSSALHLVWQENYECGDPTIDGEHRELFRLANVLIDASLRDAAEPAAINAAIDALLAHVQRHFADEEDILARRHYAQLNEHRRAHAGLLRRAGRLKARAEAGKAGLGAIVEFLAQDVVARHLIAVDRAFFPLFAKAAPPPVTFVTGAED